MNTKEYVKNMQSKYNSAKEWAKDQIYDYICLANYYEKEYNIDIKYLYALEECKDWKDVESIANNFII